MRDVKYLIIGGGISGTTAAETIRAKDKDATIVIVSDEPYRLYSRVMLSKPGFFLEKIPFDRIWMKEEKWYEDNNITLLTGKKAVELDAQSKIITLDGGEEIQYDKLLLSIGGHNRMLKIPGVDKKGVVYLRNLDDTKEIISQIKKSKRAVIIGGGFVGFEMCEMLRMAGIDVTLVIRENKFWDNVMDEDGSDVVEEALRKNGVKIINNMEVTEIKGSDSVEGVILKDGTELSCDMVLVSVGIFCPSEWIKKAGIEVNRGIIANEYLETNKPDIWASGDAAEFQDLIACEKALVGNWANAQLQGRTVALNMMGAHEKFQYVSFCNASGFGLSVVFVGNSKIDENKEAISRGSKGTNSSGRIILKSHKIIGAVLINRIQELGVIKELIEKEIDVSEKKKELGDAEFDLKKLLD